MVNLLSPPRCPGLTMQDCFPEPLETRWNLEVDFYTSGGLLRELRGERSERFSSLSPSVWVCWALGLCVPLIWASDVRQQLLGLSWGCQRIFSIKYSQKTDGDISFLQHPPSCHEQRKIFPSPARGADSVCCTYCTYSMDKW